MQIISLSFPQDRQPKMARIYESKGGRCWKIYAPGSNYTMISRRTERGAVAHAKKLYPEAGIEVVYAWPTPSHYGAALG